jgi:pimeloyl-ACP methyl ester carboxylesterase
MTRFDPASGRYVYLKIDGIDYRVYYESNGDGIPMVCQHTAAADGRQWRHVLNDKDITSKYKVIAPDLPYHGKSNPPEFVQWWTEEYKLTLNFLVSFYKEFNRALGLDRPVYIGCSMGGHLAPDLALRCPEEFRAVIGICGSVKSAMPTLAWYGHPRISNDFRAAVTMGMTAPTIPENNRRQIAWEYSQSAPSVFDGDLFYYFNDHDLTDTVKKIDTSRVAVYMFGGEYDPSTSPADVKELVDLIKGAKFIELKGLSHFAMCEDFGIFKGYLMPILDEIEKL